MALDASKIGCGFDEVTSTGGSYIEPGRDRHVRRDQPDDYLTAFLGLFPQGIAWPRESESVFYRTARGLARIWAFVDGRAADLLERESDPRKTTDVSFPNGERDGLLPEWEKAWGLPDPCFPDALTIDARRRMLVLKMTMLGAQSRAWYICVAKWLGYEIRVEEYAPFMAGVSQAGDTRDEWGDYRWYIGPPEMRFYWSVHVAEAHLYWFRSASGEAGVDHHLEIGLAPDLDCLLQRWKPAHTELIFDYSGLAAGGSMQGTP